MDSQEIGREYYTLTDTNTGRVFAVCEYRTDDKDSLRKNVEEALKDEYSEVAYVIKDAIMAVKALADEGKPVPILVTNGTEVCLGKTWLYSEDTHHG